MSVDNYSFTTEIKEIGGRTFAQVGNVWVSVNSEVWIGDLEAWYGVKAITVLGATGWIRLVRTCPTLVRPVYARLQHTNVLGLVPAAPKSGKKDTVEEYLKRGGTITECPPAGAMGSILLG
jgi:hypothetical protein